MNRIKKIITIALLLTSEIILARFLSIRTPIVVIGFSYIPLMLTAILFGPKWSVIVATISDVVGALLFPTGQFFIGYTISNALTGLVYGLLLYRKDDKKFTTKSFIIRLIISTLIVNFVINAFLNTLWVYLTTKKAVQVISAVRLVKQLITFPIKVITMLIIDKLVYDRFKKVLEK